MQEIAQKVESYLQPIDMKKILLLILLAVIIATPVLQNVYGANTIKQVIKIEGLYPANVAFSDFQVHPPVTSLAKTTVFVSFSHTGENDHSDTFRSYEMLDSDTLRIYGESTAAGNNAVEFIATIIEYESTSDMSVTHSSRTWGTSESAGEKSVTIASTTLTQSQIISKGHDHDADETTVGSEEFDRIRLLTSTTWGQLIFTNPNSSPQQNLVDVINWGDPAILSQRGIVTLAGGSSSTTVTPATAYDNTRTILLVTYAFGTGGTTSEEPDDFMLRATMNGAGQVIINRVGTEDDMQIAWELVQFPATLVKVQYDSVTLADTVAITTDTFATPVRDFAKSFAMSTVGNPYGFSTGTCASTVSGAIDRCMTDIKLISENTVKFERGDSTGANVVDYMVVELLEPVLAANPQGTNALEKVVKVEGDFTSGNIFQDYTISPALLNVDKTMMFMTMNSSIHAQSYENGKTWRILTPSTFRIFGSGNGVNDAAHFMLRFVEFTAGSPIKVQYDQMQFMGDECYPTCATADNTKSGWISDVDTTQSFILQEGTAMNGQNGLTDPTFGIEELANVELLGTNSWQHHPEFAQDDVETTVFVMIPDFNQNNISVQRGTGTLTGTTVTIIPPVAVDRTNTMLFVNYRTSGADYGESPNRASVSSTLNPSNQIVIQRSTTGINLIYSWQLVSFPSDFASIQHGIIHQNIGVSDTSTAITTVGNLANAFAVGTVNAYSSESVGRGSSSTVNDFDTVFGFFKLTDASTLNVIRGNSGSGDFDVGYQVVEWTAGVGGVNQDIQMQPSCCFFFTLPQWIFNMILPAIFIQLYLFRRLI